MQRQNPLAERLFSDSCYIAVVRLIGYDGCLYRELWDTLKELVRQYGQQRVESATVHLLVYDGQFSCKPPPLASVQLGKEVRKLCWGILGAPPEHPWHELMKRPEPLPLPWEMEPDGSSKKKSPVSEPSGTPSASPAGVDPDRLAKLNAPELASVLHETREKVKLNRKRNQAAKQARHDLALVYAEYQRRGLEMPAPGKEVAAR